MSYRFQPGKFTSHRTGRQYNFDPKDESARRSAKRQMEHDDLALSEATATRQANAPPDTRTTAERISQEARHAPRPTGTLTTALDGRLRDLNRQLARAMNEAERNQIRRRIGMIEERVEVNQQVVSAKAEREARASSPEYIAARRDAQEALDNLRFRADVDEALVQQAAKNLADLQDSLDVATFRTSAKELDETYNASKQAAIDALRSQARELQEQIRVTRLDLAPPESAPPILEPATV